MLILAIESSAKAASVALVSDGALIAQYFQNSGLTHSQTLMSMVEDMLRNTGRVVLDIELLAVAHGPGSFTGIRIGVSAAKGLAWGANIPIVGVSTLDAMSWNGLTAGADSVICASMDARRGEVYNALYKPGDGIPEKISEDRAISAQALAGECRALGKNIFLVGDGAELVYEILNDAGISCSLAPPPLRLQSAWGVAMAGGKLAPGSPGELIPVYLRLSQAERERLEKMKRDEN